MINVLSLCYESYLCYKVCSNILLFKSIYSWLLFTEVCLRIIENKFKIPYEKGFKLYGL